MTTPASPTSAARDDSERAARRIGTAGMAALLAYAAFAVLQIRVLNPLAAVPGSTLREISAAVGRTGDSMGWGLMIVVLGLGPLIAGAVAVSGRRGWLSPAGVLLAMLALLVLGTPAYFVASFPAGMTLADTFLISGADQSPWARVLFLVSLLALIALVVAAVVIALRAPSRRGRSAHADAAAFAAPGSAAAMRSSTDSVCAVETNQASKADGGR